MLDKKEATAYVPPTTEQSFIRKVDKLSESRWIYKANPPIW